MVGGPDKRPPTCTEIATMAKPSHEADPRASRTMLNRVQFVSKNENLRRIVFLIVNPREKFVNF